MIKFIAHLGFFIMWVPWIPGVFILWFGPYEPDMVAGILVMLTAVGFFMTIPFRARMEDKEGKK